MGAEDNSNHSLRSQLEFDFTQAYKDLDMLVGDVHKLDKAFEGMASNVGKFDQAIGEKISGFLKQIGSKNINVNADSVEDRLTSLFAKSFANRPIRLVDSAGKEIDPDGSPLKVHLSKARLENFEKELKDTLTDMVNTTTISMAGITAIKVKLQANKFIQLRERLNQLVTKSLDDKLDIDWDGRSFPDGKAPKFVVKKEHFDKIVNKFQAELSKHLTSAEGFDFAGKIPKVAINSTMLQSTVDKISAAFKTMDEQLKVDTEKLSNLPILADKLGGFRDKLNQTADQVAILDQVFSKFKIEDQAEGLKDFLNAVNQIKEGVVKKTTQFTTDLATIISKSPMSTIDASMYLGALQDLDQAIQKVLVERIREYTNSIFNQMGFQVIKTDKGDMVVQGLKDLQTKIDASMKAALADLGKADLGIDLSLMRSTVNEWSNWMSKNMSAQLESALGDISKELMLANHEITKALSSNIASIAKGTAGKYKSMNPEEMTAVQGKLEESLNGIYNNYTESLHNVLQFYTITSQIFGNIQKQFGGEIEKIKKASKESFAGFNIDAELNGAVESLRSNIKNDLIANIEAWRPTFNAESIKIDVNTMLAPITQAIRTMFTQVSNRIQAQVEAFMSEDGLTRKRKKAKKETLETAADEAVKTADDVKKAVQSKRKMPNVREFLRGIDDALVDYVRKQADALALEVRKAEGGIIIKTKRLHQDAMRHLAKELDSTAKDVRDNLPEISGEDIKKVMDANMKAIMESFNDRVTDHTKATISLWKKRLSGTTYDVQPVLENVDYVANQMRSIQLLIVKKIQEMLAVQFKAMREELKLINMTPVSLGNASAKKSVIKAQKEIAEGAAQAVAGIANPKATSTMIKSPVSSTGSRGTGGFRAADRSYLPGNTLENLNRMAGDTIDNSRSFMNSVVNTMRYITAGAMIGYPTMLLHSAFESTKEFDYQMQKARQNFLVKDLTTEAKVQLAGEVGIDNMASMSSKDRQSLVTERVNMLKYNAREGAIPAIQNMAIANAIDPEEVAKAYHISSRRYDNPKEALAMTNEVAKVRSIEEVDVETMAKGFEAIGSQWGLTGFDMKKVANMMIIAANISQSTVEDLVAAQQRSGALFRRNLPFTSGGEDMTKGDALATSIAMTSMFSQATARSGGEAGTFFKAILERPFTKLGRKIMEDFGSQTGFEELNPWMERADGSKVQKNAVQTIGSVIEASRKMDDPTQKRFLKQLFPAWHEPTMGALTNMVEDFQKDIVDVGKMMARMDGTPEESVNVEQAIMKYVDMIKSGDDDKVAQIQAGMMDTWKFKQQTTSSIFKVASFNVFDELKDEFSNVATYLNAFLMAINKNADSVAQVLNVASKIAMAIGGRFLVNKYLDYRANKKMGIRAGEYDNNRRALNFEAELINMRRNTAQDTLDTLGSSHAKAQAKKDIVSGKLNELDLEDLHLRDKLSAAHVSAGIISSMPEGADKDKAKDDLKSELLGINDRAKASKDKRIGLESENNAIDNELEKHNVALAKESDVLKKVNVDAGHLNNRMDVLDLSMRDQGISSKMVSVEMTRLAVDSGTAAVAVRGLDKSIDGIDRESDQAQTGMYQFRVEIEKLANELKQGKMSAEQYKRTIEKIQNLQRNYYLANKGLPMGVPGGVNVSEKNASAWGNNLSNAVMGASLFGMMGGGKKGIMSRFGGMVKGGVGRLFGKKPIGGAIGGASGISNLAKGMATASAASKTMGIMGKASKLLAPLKVLRGVPGLGLALAGFDILDIGFNAYASQHMQPHERESIRAEKLKGLAQSTATYDKKEWSSKFLGLNFNNLSKVFSKGILEYDQLKDTVTNMVGGTAPTLKDYATANRLRGQYDGKELDMKLNEQLGYEDKSRDAKIAEKKYLDSLNVDVFDKDGDHNIDDPLGRPDVLLSMEDLGTMLNRMGSELGTGQSKIERDMTVDKTRLLIQGFREDGDEMRKLMNEYFSKNIIILDSYLSDLQARRAKTDPESGEEVLTELDKAISDAEIQRAGMQLNQQQNKESALDTILTKMQRDLDMKDAVYGTSINKAIIAGAKDDSPQIKKIETARATDMGGRINQAQHELSTLLRSYREGTAQYAEIQLASQKLEQQQTGLLADIKKNTNKTSQASFNMPSGINPITNFEYMTKDNTHKNVTVRTGNVTVNVTVGKDATDKDVKKVTEAVKTAVGSANRTLVNTLSDNVKSGYGANYPIR